MTVSADTIASTSEICLLAACTKQRLHALEQEGVVSRVGRDQWLLAATIRAIIQHLRSENRRGPRTDANIRLANARAQTLELRNEREANQLLRFDEVCAAWDSVIGRLVSELGSVPARCSRDVSMRRTIEAEINRAREEVCREFFKQAETLQTSGKSAVPH